MTADQQKALTALFETKIDGKALSQRDAVKLIASVNGGVAPTHTSLGRALRGEGNHYVVSCYIYHLAQGIKKAQNG